MTNKVDWSNAPELAQFYSAGGFRYHDKHINNEYWWNVWNNRWDDGVYESLDEHMRYTDFELCPTLDDSNCNTYNPDETPDYDESLDDKWDSGELGQSEDNVVVSAPIKSDGGSSSYYDIPIPDWLVDLIVERRYIKTEELIEVMGSDFDLGNIIKCAVRINSLKNGVGKAGNDVSYDANKIVYSANRLKERDKR